MFSPRDVWDGLVVDVDRKRTQVCNGLLADWASWIREDGATAAQMKKVLARLAPDGEKIETGPLVRLSVDDARDIPSIRTPYVQAVPVLHASSGLRRVLGLAYMLLWSWNEHVRASELLNSAPAVQVILLFDELESHLHPRWQRTILRSLLDVADTLHDGARIQLVAATHSPMVLASAEPFFDAERDAWFDLDLEWTNVHLRKRQFVGHGEVSNWLTSPAFDLKSPRSLEAETAIEKASAVLREASPSAKSVGDADKALREARLPELDPFWVRWGQFAEDHLRAKPSARAKAPAKKAKRQARR